jgi:tetratricopeptide (TPR) repeat protein
LGLLKRINIALKVSCQAPNVHVCAYEPSVNSIVLGLSRALPCIPRFAAGNYQRMLFPVRHFCLTVLLSVLIARSSQSAGVPGVDQPALPSQASKGTTNPLPDSSHSNLLAIFAEGEAALRSNDLQLAEKNFLAVIAMDPRSGSAYANLGVIAMRRKQWDHALALLQKAHKLEPQISGIELNIGLVQFRRANYAAAVEPLSSVVRDQPDSQQARYLLGLCQVFTEQYADALATLEPLWSEMSADVMYLYVLDIAAQSAGDQDLDEKSLKRMLQIGGNSAEYHLILAKAYLNRQETDKALAELAEASTANPHAPFLHFNSGLAYMRAGDNDRAESEFRQDIAVEPDLPDNYEQLGFLYSRMQRNDEAEKSFREALRYDPKRTAALLGLTKLYLQEQKYKQALAAVDSALKLGPDSHNAHFMRGQALIREGRREEGHQELAVAQKLLDSRLDKDRAALSESRVPNPELTQQP